MGTAYAIGALVLSALGSVLTKVASKRFSKEIISFYIGISVLILGNLMVAFFDGSAPKFPTDFRPWMIGTFVALLGVIQQLFLIGNLCKIFMYRKTYLAPNENCNFFF